MYLSKLEIIGFKSFAQKVTLAFDSGISAIVGPNGCGKTNIVDAIRWVLGEQRYSALRSERMEDVIFNGTKTRKQLGMAEASLVIENTRGILPSEYTQVTIGRRVYRSGESEYLLNKVPCRLKDILDLFMDTGMGADAYSVIELKMIEVILSDKTDERRRLFEEAAGVTKYKHRRKAAYRKLETVQADLLRVNDIVAEVQKAVGSLERQARRAQQYNAVRERLRALEIDLMEREYAQLAARMQPLQERLRQLSAEKATIDEGLTGEEGTLEGLRTSLIEVEEKVADAQREVASRLERIQRIGEKTLVAAERSRSLRANIERLLGEKAGLVAERGRLLAGTAELKRQIAELEEHERQRADELSRRQQELAECAARRDQRRTDLQALNEQTITLVNRIAEVQTELDRMRGRVENISGREDHAAEESAAYELEMHRLDGEIAGLTAEDHQLRRAFTEAEVKFYESESRQKALKQRIEELLHRELEVKSEIERRKAEIDFLKGLIESREGMSEGVRYLASQGAWKSGKALTVADAVHADARFRAAIESALGEYAGLVIADSAAEADRGIALLKQHDKGKAAFVCLDRLPKIASRTKLPKLPGIHGWAAGIARYEPRCERLFRFLLDGILVVDGIEAAKRVTAQTVGIRCVTLDGEIVSGVGITRGGSRRRDEGGAIGKLNRIEELQKELQELDAHLGELAGSKDAVAREHDGIDLKAFADATKSVEKEMNGVEMRIAQLEFEKKRAGDIIARNREAIESMKAESSALEAEIQASSPALEDLRNEKTAAERNVGAVTLALEEVEAEHAGRLKVVNDLEIALVGLRGERQNTVNDLTRVEQTIQEIDASLIRHDEDVKRAGDEKSATAAEIAANERMVEELNVGLREAESAKSSLEDRAAAAREEMHRIELRIRDRRRSHDDSLRSIHESEMRLAELGAKSDHIRARAREEFEYDIVLKSYPEDEFVDFAAHREEIQSLRDKIKSLGNINFAAFEEYTREKERFEFLSAQRQDLLEAEKTLLATIEEINATAQRKFLETFAKIRSNFVDIFKSLFDPGDECDLKLEEDVDPLEAKIEIVAKPRGKRPTSIELLSGGEKTLTAIALLFAIYLVKPSPFCILDEVDAPLDDANIDRFNRILKKFSDNTQFIVVTHNKRTMEAANALYGVTMQEEGVSRIVTVRFNKDASVTSAALASN